MMLRKLQMKDINGMLEWMCDPDIQQNFREGIEKNTREKVLDFISKAKTEPEDGESIHYAITDNKDDYLGTISLKNIDLTNKNAEYAISLRRKAQGKGIAYKATKELLKKAFEEFALERVYLNVLSNNQRAIYLYEKCGFSYEGKFKNHLFLRGKYQNLSWYAMLREEYINENLGGKSS